MRVRRFIRRAILVGGLLFLGVQAVPYGWAKPNPPVTAPAVWPGAESESIARASCYACHSNETDWPPYSYVAPASWLVRFDVEAGRDELNFSEFAARWDAEDAADAVEDGSMPPARYTLMHRSARLTAAERAALVAAFEAMEEQADDQRGDNSGRGSDNSGAGSGNSGPG